VTGVSGNSGRDRLPPPYAQALLLRDCGVEADVIAEVLGIEPESVGPMLEVGEAKLARLRGEARDG